MAGKTDGGSTLSEKSGTRIFSIPTSEPFLDVLAGAILRGTLTGGVAPAPLEMADIVVYLPDRAACRGLSAALTRARGAGVTVLPRLRPVGGDDDDALRILTDAPAEEPASGHGLPPAISALERRMALTQLILAWSERVKLHGLGESGPLGVSVAETPAAASELALGLMRLMDEADAEGADLGQLRTLSPERFATHEQLSLDFLNIVLEAWPGYLDASGKLNPLARRARLLTLATDALREAHDGPPVIVAGVLGATPAAAALIEAVHAHPRGAVVLPGLDLHLDDDGWRALPDHPEHPQALLAGLLARLGISRSGVAPLSATPPRMAMRARAEFLGQAMRPSSTVAAWPAFIDGAAPESVRAALADVSLITAPTPREEAAAIALVLREAVETPGRTASLVTADRALARRVRAELGRWGLRLPDASGTPLASTPPGILYQLAAGAAATGSRISLLSLLKHPLTRLGLPHGTLEAAIPVIEMAGIRQPWSGDGVGQLARGIALTRQRPHMHAALERLADTEWDAADTAIAGLTEALEPLMALDRGGPYPLRDLARAHRLAIGRLTEGEDGAPVGAGQEGAAMAAFLDALAADLPSPPLTLKDYPALLRGLMAGETCPDPEAAHARLRILPPREARLGHADVMVLGGVNEGSWPEAGEGSPWLNRAMREALGLAPAERQVALSAHGFMEALGAPEVVLTRALKADGTPTVPSRWLSRLEALLGGLGLGDALDPKRPWLEWATADEGEAPVRAAAKAPAPRPPVTARPRQLSISEVETLMANPYGIYARNVLGLTPLEALEIGPGGGERSRVIHDTLHRFAQAYPQELPEDTASELMAIFDREIAPLGDNARIAAFWRPRMVRFARWFAETEPARRAGVARVAPRVSGLLTVDAPGGPFTVRGTVDRIDLREDGTLALYDYRTGSAPSEADVASGKAPHLPLAALIAQSGTLRGIESHDVARLATISAKGGDPAGEEVVVKQGAGTLAKVVRDGLKTLIERFDDEATSYQAMRRAAFSARHAHDAYAHLARVEEWAGASGGGDEG